MTARLTSADRDALREAAEKADRWLRGVDNLSNARYPLTAFHEAADPSTILSLLDENEELRKPLREIDPEKLELLASWIDAKYPNDSNPEVQRDLRSWASLLRAALSEETKEETK